jgi:hypothetical protein
MVRIMLRLLLLLVCSLMIGTLINNIFPYGLIAGFIWSEYVLLSLRRSGSHRRRTIREPPLSCTYGDLTIAFNPRISERIYRKFPGIEILSPGGIYYDPKGYIVIPLILTLIRDREKEIPIDTSPSSIFEVNGALFCIQDNPLCLPRHILAGIDKLQYSILPDWDGESLVSYSCPKPGDTTTLIVGICCKSGRPPSGIASDETFLRLIKECFQQP